MSGVIQSVLTVISSVASITGCLGNGFIVLVNGADWVRRRKISPVDQILTALAISRMGVLWSALLHPFLPEFDLGMLNILWIVTNHFNLWLSTSLSIFYLLKIANFSNSVFLYLKWRVRKVVSVTLLLSLVLLFLNIVLMNTHVDVWIGGSKGNMSDSSSLRNSTQFSQLRSVINPSFTVIPFSVSLMACLLLIFSLWRHLRAMRHSALGPRDASTTAHGKALQIGVTFLLLYAIFFLSLVLQMSNSKLLETKLVILFCQVAVLAFPSVHPWVLIVGDGKLRRASLSVLWRLRCRSKDAGPSGA